MTVRLSCFLESDHLLYFLLIKSDQKQREGHISKETVIVVFWSRLVEEELSFLALATVSKQKAAPWWVWLAACGSEISGRAVRWMPSWPACDVQFVARASLGRKALKILLAVTQREMWCCSRKPSPNTFLLADFTSTTTWLRCTQTEGEHVQWMPIGDEA